MGAAETDTDAATDEEVVAAEPRVESTDDVPWYLTTKGMVVFGIDAVLAVVIVVGTTGVASTILDAFGVDWTAKATVDPFVYLFALLGALGYVFTAIIKRFERSATDLLKYNVRLLAALPLAAGVYLLAELLFGEIPSNELLAGFAFVGGLYVNLAYERIGSLADRLFQPETE